jgi:peptidoglycan/xylan/chitin deacetylase (PgdA/CDA1 family)
VYGDEAALLSVHLPMRSIWLMYHDVTPIGDDSGAPGSARRYHVSTHAFRAQLDAIEARGVPVVAASRATSGDGDSVVLTFDDGWLGSFDVALPMLVERGLTATYYVTREFVGRPGFCSESVLVEAANAGMEIGVHGTTHRMLSACSRDEVMYELRTCKDYLQSLLQRDVVSASVPGGDWTEAVAACAAEVGLTSLSTSRPGFNTPSTSPLALRRVAVTSETTVGDVTRYCRFDTRRESARWALLQAPRRLLGMQRYSRLRRRLLGERPGDGTLFDP